MAERLEMWSPGSWLCEVGVMYHIRIWLPPILPRNLNHSDPDSNPYVPASNRDTITGAAAAELGGYSNLIRHLQMRFN